MVKPAGESVSGLETNVKPETEPTGLERCKAKFTVQADQFYAALKALEFAEYMAKAGEALRAALSDEDLALSRGESAEVLEECYEAHVEAWRKLTNATYEFRKRAEKVKPGS